MKRAGRAALAVGGLAVAVAVAAALLWWTVSPAPDTVAGTESRQGMNVPGIGPSTSARSLTAPAVWDIPAPPLAAASNDPLLTPGLRDTLEALLLAAGEATEPQRLKQRLEGLIGEFFPPQVATRALAMAHRYVDYRVALGQLRAPADLRDPQALRQALAARQTVRQAYFEPDEFQALFAADADMDQYLLARLEIERSPSLTAEQKQGALQQAEGALGPALQAQRAAAVAHIGVAQQSAAFDAQGTDASTRFTARSAQYGAQAAQRLAQLDTQEQQWQSRLGQYQAAVGSAAPEIRLAQLRDELFTPQEQLRLNAALALREQPGAVAP